MIPKRFLVAVFCVILGLHYFLAISHDSYAQATSDTLTKLADRWRYTVEVDSSTSLDSPGTYTTIPGTPKCTPSPTSLFMPTPTPTPTPQPTRKANATLVMLARNRELYDVIASVKAMEDRFNRHYEYPWIFLNDEPFSEEFKSRILPLTNANVSFGLVPKDHWVQPDTIDENRASLSRAEMVSKNIIYGGSVSYRNMCRFNSGFFFRHPLLDPYRYYWRVEPNVKYFCDLDYDPFLYMSDNNKTYGFTITLEEFPDTVTTLWDKVKEFKQQNPHLVARNNAQNFLSHDNGETYNMCHFWSNFEIADLDFWRGEAYMKLFQMLDDAGGFYYERWGDAPVHSIAAALLLPKEQLHFFSDIGYRHEPFQHCPQGEAHTRGKCSCDPGDNFDYQGWASCMDVWDSLWI